ncbi:hypothetical protein EXS72_01285 [Candidatus Pacearchaeota archaeon]|nr:hypothetical protein [Candidatus Pacearchaeota archaeon]
MKKLSRKDAQEIIYRFFESQRIESAQVKKIKKLAMTHRIRLGEYRKRFCKKCYVDLKFGKVRVSNRIKQIICNNCGNKNKWKI